MKRVWINPPLGGQIPREERSSGIEMGQGGQKLMYTETSLS
jgi:hypothetical protein